MDTLLIVLAVLIGLVVVMQIFVLLRRPPDMAGQLAIIGERLDRIGAGTQDAGKDVVEMRGRLASLDDAQGKTRESVLALQADFAMKVTEGFQSVSDTVRGTVSTELVPRLEASAKAAVERDGQSAVVINTFLAQMRDEAAQYRNELTSATNAMRTEVSASLKASAESVEKKMSELRSATDAKLGEIVTRTAEGAQALNETATKTIASVTDRLAELKTALDGALKAELGAIRTENSAKLDEMRRTVDEKLHATLEQRLGESFKLVSERLELVHRGLGEMQTLAAGVGDLKKVLTNVKTRGTWGEIQLEALLEQILTAEQYGKNVATRPGSSARVEFAIRLPGKEDGAPVWLPIDAKFPMEDYQRLVDAQDRVDPVAIEEAGKALESRIKNEARTIREKYIEAPHTTDFAILYLPTEGLYAEVLRRPGLADTVQRDSKIMVAGPTTLAAMLNSLQMGFRTLAIEKRSSEVWMVLGAVKTEFGKFGDALAHTKKKLEEASNSIDNTERRNRALTRRLSGVDAMPAPEAALLIDGPVALRTAGDGATVDDSAAE